MYEKREVLKGTNVTIDFVLVRHAEREPITPEMLLSHRSPALTPSGIANAQEWGSTILRSDEFMGHYDGVFFTGTSVPRTQHTAILIAEGAHLPSSVIKSSFPAEKGVGFDNILRLRPDGRQWNNEKIVAAGRQIFVNSSPLYSEINTLCKASGQDSMAVIADIQKAIATDNSVLPILLQKYFPPITAGELASRVVSDLYDEFIDREEAHQYMAHPLDYLVRLANKTLPNQTANTNMLIIGVTHDFNIAGLIKGMLGKKMSEVAGAPAYLAHLHFRLKKDMQGKTVVETSYNGVHYELLPEILSTLISYER